MDQMDTHSSIRFNLSNRMNVCGSRGENYELPRGVLVRKYIFLAIIKITIKNYDIKKKKKKVVKKIFKAYVEHKFLKTNSLPFK